MIPAADHSAMDKYAALADPTLFHSVYISVFEQIEIYDCIIMYEFVERMVKKSFKFIRQNDELYNITAGQA